jgi:crossover junction endodeoxyribonuclease RuvC
VNHSIKGDIAVGIDPGSRISGVGIVESNGSRLRYIRHQAIRIPDKMSQPDKLVYFANQFQEVLDHYDHATLVIESLFTYKNVNSILKLSHIRGVAIMMAAKKGWAIEEYAPATVKVSVTGYGRATKEQVQYMVQKILKMNAKPTPADCADALALAICYLGQAKLKKRIKIKT